MGINLVERVENHVKEECMAVYKTRLDLYEKDHGPMSQDQKDLLWNESVDSVANRPQYRILAAIW